MRAALLGLVLTLAALMAQQFPPPPPPPPPPPAPARGQTAPSAATPALTAAQCKCSIEVTVKRPGGEPISDVDLTLTASTPANANSNDPDVTLTATTDASGHAVFRDLAQANYMVRAERNGYLGPTPNVSSLLNLKSSAAVNVGPATNVSTATNDAADISAIFSAALAIAGLNPVNAEDMISQPNHHVQMTMIQGATISGLVQDSNRRPLSGVQVGAFRVEYRDGQRILAAVGRAVQTDDRGEYRLFWFPPGEYYVRTATQAAALVRTQGFPMPTYYPGTLDATRAIPVVLNEGQEVTGAGFSIQQPNGVTVSGTIVNNAPGGRIQPNGQLSRSVSSVYLVPRNASFLDSPQPIPIINVGARGNNPDGVNTPFEIRGVPPGTYDLYPISNDSGAGTAVRLNYYTGRTPIDVGSENVTGVTAVIQPGVDLKGHVTITGTPPPSTRPQPVTMTNIRLQLRSIDNLPTLVALNTSVVLDNDGNFTMANLVDARYIITTLSGIPADAYVSDMRMGSQGLYDDGIVTIGKGVPEPLEIVVSRGGSTVQGTVQDAQHHPVASTRVVLIPEAPHRHNFMLYKTSQSNAMGNFTMSGVAPGSYKLFAWESLPNGAEQNAEFMREYEQRGTSIMVSPGVAAAGVTVTMIPAKH